jgi:hypothetical protein
MRRKPNVAAPLVWPPQITITITITITIIIILVIIIIIIIIGGRGLIYITRLHDKKVKLLQTYFLNKQSTTPLQAAVVKANDRYTPLDLFRANENEIATDEEYTNEVNRQWSQKALHGRHPYDLSQQYVDIEASNKRLTSADLFAEREGFLTAIQDQVILKRNYKKYILKQPNIDELCRCGRSNTLLRHVSN